jgi:hypothetical protein
MMAVRLPRFRLRTQILVIAIAALIMGAEMTRRRLTMGWSLVPDNAHGVVLANRGLGMALSAHAVYLMGVAESEGFRLASVSGV